MPADRGSDLGGPRRLRLDLPPTPHDYLIGAGALTSLGSEVVPHAEPGPCVVVTDPGAAGTGLARRAAASLAAAGFDPRLHDLPAGEDGKTLDAARGLWDALAAAGVERRGLVVAVGGGAVGDAAGFCAATWMRGVALVQAPTTLLAMADSAVGGKTALNLPAGKNLVGAVHMPCLVVADLDALASLPRREISSGLAEIVKCAALADREGLQRIRDRAGDLLSGHAGALAEAVEAAVRVKADHVREDPQDVSGRRALLNLGHTTAHALEAEEGFGALRHGEAVAVGLVVAARLGARLGTCDAALVELLVETLAALELPTEIPAGADLAALAHRARSDKKRRGGRHLLVLPTDPCGAVLREVEEDDLLAALAETAAAGGGGTAP